MSIEFGKTVETVRREGYEHIETIDLDSRSSGLPTNIDYITKYSTALSRQFILKEIDIVLAQGDRLISLASAIAGTYSEIPVAHLHGGEVSGTIDETTRHCVTKMSHIHFAATKKSFERIEKLGEKRSNIFLVGAPAIEYISSTQLLDKADVYKLLNFPNDQTFLVVLFNPDSPDIDIQKARMNEICSALLDFDVAAVFIYPNNDSGCRGIIRTINEFEAQYPGKIRAFKSLPYHQYLSVLKCSNGLIGNSSGGIIETPTLGIPNLCIGDRQHFREKAENNIDVKCNRNQIHNGLRTLLSDHNFLVNCKATSSPYNPNGDFRVSSRIIEVLESISLDGLLEKTISY